jgi:hypothetical protein
MEEKSLNEFLPSIVCNVSNRFPNHRKIFLCAAIVVQNSGPYLRVDAPGFLGFSVLGMVRLRPLI